ALSLARLRGPSRAGPGLVLQPEHCTGLAGPGQVGALPRAREKLPRAALRQAAGGRWPPGGASQAVLLAAHGQAAGRLLHGVAPRREARRQHQEGELAAVEVPCDVGVRQALERAVANVVAQELPGVVGVEAQGAPGPWIVAAVDALDVV